MKLIFAAAALLMALLAGCANQPGAAVGGTGMAAQDTWNGIAPEQPGHNRWGTNAATDL